MKATVIILTLLLFACFGVGGFLVGDSTDSGEVGFQPAPPPAGFVEESRMPPVPDPPPMVP
ncbi:MAG: hypothetical protein Kow0037_14710 [Calditrichia bacterium]